MNSASIVDLMEDDLDVSEAVILDHITAILYVGWRSAGKDLMEKEAQACVKHFSPYIKWRGVAVEQEFQALMLSEGGLRRDQSPQSLKQEDPPRVWET